MRSRDSPRDVPSTVGAERMGEVLTPRSSNQHDKFNFSDEAIHHVEMEKKTGRSREVDAYHNPTELFELINVGDFDGAIQRTLESPSDAKTWIISRGQPKSKRDKVSRDAPVIWRYLPLHLVCLKPNPTQQLTRAILHAYPKAAKYRDHNGNLAIHHVLAEGSDDPEIIELLLEVYPDSLHKKNGKDQSLGEIVASSFHCGKISKGTMMIMMSVIREFQPQSERNHTPALEKMERRESRYDERDAPETYSMMSYPIVQSDGSFFDDANVNHAPTPRSKTRYRSRSRSSREDLFCEDAKANSVPTPKARRRGRSRSNSRDFFQEDLQTSSISTPKSRKHDTRSRSRPRESARERKASSNNSGAEREMMDGYTDERDVLRKQVSEMKEQNALQNTTIEQLNKKLDGVSSELNQEKGKLEEKLTNLDDMLRKFQEHEKEKDQWQQRMAQMESDHRRNIEESQKEKESSQEARSDAPDTEILSQMTSLRKELRDERSKRQPTSSGEIEKVMADAQANERRFQATIQSLERELLVALGAKKSEDGVDNITKEAYKTKIASLERELLECSRMKKTIVHETEMIKTDAFIAESQLNGKIASLERQLHEASEQAMSTSSQLKSHITSLERQLQEASEQVKAATPRAHDESEWEKQKSKIESLEKELLESNKKNSTLMDEIAVSKSETTSRQNKLEAKLVSLETELAEAAQIKKDSIIATGEAKAHEEERMSLQLLNSSLQDSIKPLKEKCNKLEQSLVDMKQEKKDLEEQAVAAKIRHDQDAEFKEKHKELQAEFQKLWSFVQNMPKEREGATKKTAEDYEQRVQALRDIITNNYNAHEQKVDAMVNKQTELQTENEGLKGEIDELKTQIGQLNEEAHKLNLTADDTEATHKHLLEMTQRANSYREQLTTLQVENESLKSNNSNLREIIVKNNNTFTAKVDTLRNEQEDLKRSNESLDDIIRELSTENTSLKEKAAMMMSSAQAGPSSSQSITNQTLKELSNRLNHVASYLISVSEMQKRIVKGELYHGGESRQDDSTSGGDSARLMGISVQERVILNGSSKADRDDILMAVGELRSHEDKILVAIKSEPHRDLLGETLHEQHQELAQITSEMGALRR